MFDKPAFAGHESVHPFFDEKTGLKAIIAIHSTARGPAAGGCRMWNYATSDEALVDALRLSRGMSYKNAMADLALGGGKAVIIGDSKTDKTPELFRAFGRAIDTLDGHYWSAEDVGVSVHDMAYAAEETKYVAGLPTARPRAAIPPVTAEGVFRGIKAAALRAFGTDDLNGVHVAVQGVGHVGALPVRAAGQGRREADDHRREPEALATVAAGARARRWWRRTRSTTSRPTSSRRARWARSSTPRRCRA